MKSRALNLAVLALLVSLCGWTGTAVRPAAAQALDAGKPPAQIFSGTCSACHRSPRGLVRSISPGSLPGFLRQHYTTGSEMAGTMSAYVLGNGGTDRVAEPAPKREPKQRPRSDAPDVAGRNPDQKEQAKSTKQRAAKKGQAEPAPAAKDEAPDGEPEKADAAKPEPEPPKAETAAVDCKVDEPPKQTAAADENGKAETDATPPRQPIALLTLPGFPAPEPEPEPQPEPVAATPPQPGCDPPVNTAAASPAASVEEAPKEQQKEAPPPTVAEAAKPEPSQSAATEDAASAPDIMQEEVHAPRPRANQKKRAAQ